MMSDILSGHRILVSGSEQGAVLTAARACACGGAQVCVSTRSTTVTHSIEQLGATVIPFGGWGEAPVSDLADRVRGRLGRIDGFVIIVGQPTPLVFSDIDEAEFDDAIRRSLKDVFLQLQACSPLLAAQASVVLFFASCRPGRALGPMHPIVREGGLALCRHLAECWEAADIRVNALIEPADGENRHMSVKMETDLVYLLSPASRPLTGAMLGDGDGDAGSATSSCVQ